MLLHRPEPSNGQKPILYAEADSELYADMIHCSDAMVLGRRGITAGAGDLGDDNNAYVPLF
jgi:hypothetical protein